MAPLFSMDDSETEDALKKLFIGGLNRNTSDETLKTFFASYGEVVDCVVIRNEEKTSRGFGFVTYETIEATDLCINSKPHNIDGKDLEVKRAIPRDNNGPTAHLRTKKIFVGGLPQTSTKELLEELFNSNDELKVKVTADVIMDKLTEKCKGFGFLECEDEDMADKLSIIRKFNINDKQVELKKAEPKEPGRSGMRGRGRGAQGGGGGRGRGYNNYGGDSYGSGYDNYDYYGNSYNNGGYNGAGGWDNYQGGGSGYWDQGGYGQSSYGGGGAAYGSGYAAGGGGGGGGGGGYQGSMNQGRGNRGTSRGGRYRPY